MTVEDTHKKSSVMAESDVELEDLTLGKEDINDVHTMPWPAAIL